jgi:hypothetical protein
VSTLAKISLALLVVKFPLIFLSLKTSFFTGKQNIAFISGILSGLCCLTRISIVFSGDGVFLDSWIWPKNGGSN